jgi:hypothetical protein
MQQRNRYFVCLWRAPGRAQPPVAWDPAAETPHQDFAGSWWGRVFQAAEAELGDRGLTVYLTWDLHELPSYGEDVVAVVLGDEWGLTPRYAHRIRAAFKVHGNRPWLERKPLHEHDRLSALTLVRYLRSTALRLPDDLRDLRDETRGRPSARRATVADLPVGYSNLLDLPIRPIEERPTDVSFAGSVENQRYGRRSLQHWLGTPKQVARKQMVDAVERFAAARPERTVSLRVTDDYWASMGDDPANYSQRMMDTKVCLSPRGTTVETYRVFEGLRYGCIVVCDPLPKRWYYKGAPVVQLRRWRDLPGVLDELLGDPEGLRHRHEEAITFWRERCSEGPVGCYVAARVLAAGR